MNRPFHSGLRHTSSGGFTLIEVLVAVVVLALGILGVAALQTASVSQGKGSLQAVQANALAMDLADRMRVNSSEVYLGKYLFDNTSTGTASSVPTAPSPSCNTSSGAITVCAADKLAQQDLYNWYTLVTQQLPSPTVKVTCPDGTCQTVTPQTASITIYWNENKSSTTLQDKDCGTSTYDPTKDLPCVVLAFQP